MNALTLGDLVSWNGNLYTFGRYEPEDEEYCYINSVFLTEPRGQNRCACVQELRKPEKEVIDLTVEIMKNQINIMVASLKNLEEWSG
jgi:hypothetical protein